ncbi:MAG TPA: SURF1 family cytochrome oxidase biogenesis protein, partial [Pilimelia sp.]|nr:SURF1 family cytochrome oxidase biogenesis protein [Pilimelia sp.]
GDATSRPPVPPTPTGVVTVAGRVAPPEARRGGVDRRDGRLEVRRIAPAQLATALPYPIFGGYVLLDEGQPGAAPELAAVPSPRARAWQNAGYAVQWWLFAVLTLVGYGWLARREAHGPPSAGPGDRVDAATAATSR